MSTLLSTYLHVKISVRESNRIHLISGVTQKFDEICYYCGDTELVSDGYQTMIDLKKQYSIVRQIYDNCLTEGKLPAVRNALKIGQKRK